MSLAEKLFLVATARTTFFLLLPSSAAIKTNCSKIAFCSSYRAHMQPYKNLSGTSGVVAFEAGESHIDIEFQDGHRYRYDYAKTGKNEVEIMKSLALTGKGLATFINQSVRERFAQKLP
jgi:hypothetical protein